MPRETDTDKGYVEFCVRRFHEDPKGDVLLPDGRIGFYSRPKKTFVQNLLTDAGRDFVIAQCYSTSPGANGGNFIGVSAESTAPAASDTTLAGEIATGGLARAQGVYSHTAGTGIVSLSATFTATAVHTSVQKAGLFTAASGGTLVREAQDVALDLAIGDMLVANWVVTLA